MFAVAAAEGLDRFAIWGQSMGGLIAWMTAAAAPARVPAIVTTGAWDPRPKPKDPTESDEWVEMWTDGILDEDLRSFPVPALLIAGELEDENDDATNVAAMIPNGQSLPLPGLGHGGAMTASTLTIPHARAFFDRWFA